MLKWVLILALNGQYELRGVYQSESECEKAAGLIVEAEHNQKKGIKAGCYQHVSTTNWAPDRRKTPL